MSASGLVMVQMVFALVTESTRIGGEVSGIESSEVGRRLGLRAPGYARPAHVPKESSEILMCCGNS